MAINEQNATAANVAGARLWGNALLALLKIAIGLLAGSKALLADACYSATVAVRSWSEAARPAGREVRAVGPVQPLGVVAAIICLVAGLEIAVSAIREMAAGEVDSPGWIALAAALVAVLLHRLLVAGPQEMAARIASAALLVGTAGAYAGELFAVEALYYLDPAASVAIAAAVLWTGYQFIGGSAPASQAAINNQGKQEDVSELLAVVQRVEGIIMVEGIRAWESGHYVAVEMSIYVNPRITMLEGHEIAKRAKELLLKRFGHITEVTVLVHPYDAGYPYKSNHDSGQEAVPTLLQ